MTDEPRKPRKWESVCVLCGADWHPAQNVCKCGGFCSWGKEKGGPPDSWIVNGNGSWSLRPVPGTELNAD